MMLTYKLAVPRTAKAIVTIEAEVGELDQMVDQLDASPHISDWPLNAFLQSLRSIIMRASGELSKSEPNRG